MKLLFQVLVIVAAVGTILWTIAPRYRWPKSDGHVHKSFFNR